MSTWGSDWADQLRWHYKYLDSKLTPIYKELGEELESRQLAQMVINTRRYCDLAEKLAQLIDDMSTLAIVLGGLASKEEPIRESPPHNKFYKLIEQADRIFSSMLSDAPDWRLEEWLTEECGVIADINKILEGTINIEAFSEEIDFTEQLEAYVDELQPEAEEDTYDYRHKPSTHRPNQRRLRPQHRTFRSPR